MANKAPYIVEYLFNAQSFNATVNSIEIIV